MQGLLGVGGFVRSVSALGLLSLVLVTSVADAQDAAPAVLVVTPSDAATSGAAIRIDGEPTGNVPLRKTLTPGRHLLQVGKRGFATFSKWVDLVGGEVLTIPVALKPQATETGSLLITADVTGMAVYIDGQRRGGTPLVVDGLSAGEHEVEIQSPGEGYRPFRKVVTITANPALRPGFGSTPSSVKTFNGYLAPCSSISRPMTPRANLRSRICSSAFSTSSGLFSIVLI